jgi:glutamate/tyrosine decarboxylase-like PLP-dependent enzyme
MAIQVPARNGGTLTRPAKGETMNPNGRPKKTFTLIMQELKDEGYAKVSQANIVEAYETLFGLDETKLKEIIENKARPMLLRIVAKRMLSPKGYEALETMMDRAHGRAVQRNQNDTSVKIEGITEEQKKKLDQIQERLGL